MSLWCIEKDFQIELKYFEIELCSIRLLIELNLIQIFFDLEHGVATAVGNI